MTTSEEVCLQEITAVCVEIKLEMVGERRHTHSHTHTRVTQTTFSSSQSWSPSQSYDTVAHINPRPCWHGDIQSERAVASLTPWSPRRPHRQLHDITAASKTEDLDLAACGIPPSSRRRAAHGRFTTELCLPGREEHKTQTWRLGCVLVGREQAVCGDA